MCYVFVGMSSRLKYMYGLYICISIMNLCISTRINVGKYTGMYFLYIYKYTWICFTFLPLNKFQSNSNAFICDYNHQSYQLYYTCHTLYRITPLRNTQPHLPYLAVVGSRFLVQSTVCLRNLLLLQTSQGCSVLYFHCLLFH